MSKPPPLDDWTKKWMEYANTHEADQHGFVRVRESSNKEWDGKPALETLVLKGFTNDIGSPLIIDATNVDYPGGGRGLSNVSMMIEPDLGLRYQFSSREFPESTWVDLHNRVLEFLKFLQMPK